MRPAGSLNLDFAVSEHIGRFQAGLAGLYITQIADDTQFGIHVPPDGAGAEVLEFGPVLAYDLPEYGASVKIKALKSVSQRERRQRLGRRRSAAIKKFQ